MSVISRLEDIEVYNTALTFASEIYSLTASKTQKEYSLNDQIRRSALSIAANIAEGYGRRTKKDFAQFLSIANGSLNETVAYLSFIELHFHIDTKPMKDRFITLGKRIMAFRNYLLTTKN